jgi:nucleoside diphosphate kinase
MELKELAQKYVALRDKRKEREAVIVKMKTVEEQLIGMIANQMKASGMKTAKFDDLGSFTAGSRDHVEIRDKEKMARFILGRAAKMLKEGLPVADAMSIYQQRAAIRTVVDLMAQGVDITAMGVEIVEKPTLKFTKV